MCPAYVYLFKIMNPDFYHWIEDHIDDDPNRLRLKYGHERDFEILQIDLRRKHSLKLGEIFKENPGFVFPNSLSAEQSTSVLLAEFHSGLIKSGSIVADLTAGLGIDSIYFSKRAARVVAVEKSREVAEALRLNTKSLGNIEVINRDCKDALDEWAASSTRFDTVFIDPARRDKNGKRVYALKDCEPDVLEIIGKIAQITPRLIIKTSPMLDITQTCRELTAVGGVTVNEIISLGTTTECKELDIICHFNKHEDEPSIRAVTLSKDNLIEFDFKPSQERDAVYNFGSPEVGQYLFDPYPSIMKAAPYKLLGQRFGIDKIAANTHLWCASTPVADFPGQTYRIIDIEAYMSKNIKRYASKFPRAGVSARNFDVSSDVLRTKLKVKEGDLRLFAVTTYENQKLLITCEKI